VKRSHLLLGVLALLVAPAFEAGALGGDVRPVPGAGTPSDQTGFTKDVVPFLAKHCYTCHGKTKQKADLALDGFRDEQSVLEKREIWENVLEMVRSGEMPPKERPRPAPSEVEPALRGIDAVLAKLDCSGPRNVGRVTLRRLNREEYNNTIRDLVGVDFKPASDFPNDDVGYGFDNIGDVLSLSPLLFEKYLAAAESILERAIVVADPPKPSKARLDIRAGFGVSDVRPGFGRFLHSRGAFNAESYVDEGDYIVRAEVFSQQADDEPVRAALRVNGAIVDDVEVRATRMQPATIEANVRLKNGTSRFAVTFLNPYRDPELKGNDRYRRLLFLRNITLEGPFNPPPPVLPEIHRRIMAHRPELPPREAAREIITRFATRAFRRPVKPDEVERLLKLYDKAEKEGERFEDRVRLALEGILVWPAFLFRVELDPPGAKPGETYPVDEYALASRLSYFLWSSMPDDELFALAGQGRLRQELEGQVRRMLRDPKSAAFVRNFAGQWLTTRKLAYVAPDPKEFPDFDEELRASMARETELFFEAILREDRNILDLLDADFSFVNERLAKHYGISGVKGKEFRRVTLPPNRGGILTQASVLTLTSNPTRTAPVKRGKWVLDQILGTPPPPPPPDVPTLDEEKRLTGSLRKVMELHRENALCASCHRRMDPIGFAFENYDAVGAWRDKDGEFPIDPSGILPDGRSFQGPAELKAILRTEKEAFRRCLTEKLLTFALGRGLEYYDKCAVDQILETLDRNGDRMGTLVLEVIQSEPFQKRTATGSEP
jgi:hypothetical protein